MQRKRNTSVPESPKRTPWIQSQPAPRLALVQQPSAVNTIIVPFLSRIVGAILGRAIAVLREAVKAVPNQYPGKEADVELLSFTERGQHRAVRRCTHTDHDWQVYFGTNRVIADSLSSHGFPVPRIPVQMQPAAAN